MKIRSIEPTPNPNSMKLTMDESLPDGAKLSFASEERGHAPAYIQRLLEIEGVKSVYQVADFMALERSPRADWQPILARVREVLEAGDAGVSMALAPAFGEVTVSVQMFRGIPMQVKLASATEELRAGLPERFKKAAMEAAAASPDLLRERRWEERGVRHGDIREIGEEIAAQIDGAYGEERLARLVAQAISPGAGEPAPAEPLAPAVVLERLGHSDWKQRYAALEQLEPAPEALDVLLKAFRDPHPSVRRLATVYLGALEGSEVLPYLFEALKDPSKLVRWRAARFLYEVGDQSALPALRGAQDDPEFEVALQVEMAIERIEGGKGAVLPAWQQMTRQLGE